MIDAFFAGLLQIFQLGPFLYLILGSAIGFMVGILPGIGAAPGLALMLPFVYGMDPAEAFPFLLGMYSVCATTGDITTILFGIPGEAISVALVMDGYPMSKKGEAGRALGAALMSSLVGAIFGAAFLTVVIPVVRPLVLFFAAPEMFMLVIIGLTCLSSLSGQGGSGLVKGMLTGGLGLFCALLGQDQLQGIHRYTFESLYLLDGLPLIPVMVGIYAIPEIVELIVRDTSIAAGISHDRLGKGVMEGIKDTFRYFGVTVRGSLIGAVFGLIPGVGGGVAQWAAYAQAKNSAKTPEEAAGFGKGDVRGVLGPGAANNSKEGGHLIPTVAFGIPAGPSMAILLGAFLLLGLVPGPDMLTRHLSLTFSMVWTIVISNVLCVSVCLLFINHVAKLTMVRANLIVPFLLILCFIGAYSSSSNIADIITLLVMGSIGYLMTWVGWPRPPFILGFILGDLAESYLFSATTRYGAAWLLRPTVIFLLLVAVMIVIYPYLKQKRYRKKKELDEVIR